MQRSTRHKARTRQKILKKAAALFRKNGVKAVSIDGLMAASGLTRGGFYAHFRSKQQLFAEVVRQEHPMLRMLANRPGTSAHELRQQMLQIFGGYLDPANLEEIASGCTMAALSREASVAGGEAQGAYGEAFEAILKEMSRGQIYSADNPDICTALVTAIGAVTVAAANGSRAQRTRILEGAYRQFCNLVPDVDEPQ